MNSPQCRVVVMASRTVSYLNERLLRVPWGDFHELSKVEGCGGLRGSRLTTSDKEVTKQDFVLKGGDRGTCELLGDFIGTSCVLDDIVEVTKVGSERVSSDPSNVIVALSAGKKGNGSLPSSAADEEVAANPSRVYT
ncbi:hypothetical protein Tco_0934285 [Tanacetum coccineum]